MKMGLEPTMWAQWFSGVTCRVNTRSRKLYLTFDDGPTPEITLRVLATLKLYQAKATFFCLGKQVEAHPDIYQWILDEGHSVGNHGYNHLEGLFTAKYTYLKDVARAGQIIQSPLFRPPYGKMTPQQLVAIRKKYRVILWDVLSYDFRASVSPESCLNRVIDHSRRGSIVVFHDNEKSAINMLYALPRVLSHFSEKGYEFARITPRPPASATSDSKHP
jgi:peptidoglycan-N-acetylglucosamine deacetylase